MRAFLKEDPETFKKYALTDSVLSLYHSLVVEDSFIKETSTVGIPVTIASLARRVLENQLLSPDYKLKSPNGKFTEGSISKLYTPEGINLSGDLSSYLPLFLASYRGGRNECYIHGMVPGPLFDYDLTGAYPTAMSMLSYPDHDKKVHYRNLLFSELKSLVLEPVLMKSFSAFKVSFEFDSSVLYPNLPVTQDAGSIVFPLSGDTICTGLELLLADRLGCTIKILDSVIIPFKKPQERKQSSSSSIREDDFDPSKYIVTDVEREVMESMDSMESMESMGSLK